MSIAEQRTVVLIFAGGSGQRMNAKSLPDVPKQFLEYAGKSIIIYTLEHFDQHPDIDGIVVVCLAGWIEHLRRLLVQHGISRVLDIVAGGATGQESIRLGLEFIAERFSADSIVLVHDGVRPLISKDLISANIACARGNGNAITTAPAVETIMALDTGEGGKYASITKVYNRSHCVMARAPQTFLLGDLLAAHRQVESLTKGSDSRKRGRSGNTGNALEFIDSASIMQHFGHRLFLVQGPAENIKITTPSDYYTFCALMQARERE